MSEHTTPGGVRYLLEATPEVTTCTHSDLAEEAAAVSTPGEPVERYAAIPLSREGYRTQPIIELLWVAGAQRAGLAPGGDADWTDAESPADALERYLGIHGKSPSD
jgi:hypothetical protein